MEQITKNGEQFRMKLVSSVEKVLASLEPSGKGMRNKITLLKGETVSFQAAYYWAGPWRAMGQVRISAPEDIQVKARLVKLVPCAYPCHVMTDEHYLATEPGMYPDLLSDVPAYGIPLVAGQWRSIWIDIEAPEDVKAGEYEVEVILEWEGGTETAKVTADVIDTELPPVSIPHTEWFHSDGLCHYYGVEVFSEEFWRIVENFVATAVKRGSTMLLTPIFTPPLDTAVGGERLTVQLVDVYKKDGVYSFGFEKFERWVKMCERCRIRYFEMSHLFSQWGAKYAPKIMGYTDGAAEAVQLFGWDTDGTGAEYTEFLHAFLDAFLPELEKLGLQKRCYFHISDEPNISQVENYRAARDIVKEKLKDYPIMDALSDYTFYKEGLVQEPVCATNHIEPFLADRPEKLWAYYCTGQYEKVSNRFIVMQGSRTRILGLQLYKYDIAGFLQWGYNFYNSQYSLRPINPYACTDADGAFPSGDAFLVDPGEGGVPEESIRLMMMSEAMNDLAAMKLLEMLAGRAAVLRCLDEETVGEITFSEYPADVEYVIKVRERVNEAIRDTLRY